MAKDDITLGVEMGKLEIEPVKIIKHVKEENPFIPNTLCLQKKKGITRTSQQNMRCSCTSIRRVKNLPICKKKHSNILKEPVLKLLQVHAQTCNSNEDCYTICSKKILPQASHPDNVNLCALVDNCNQLRISSGANEPPYLPPEQNHENRWWKNGVLCSKQPKETSVSMSQAGSCSQQALNPPCDVTIDELASYFETLVHIPKKMSSMAEMMYI